MYTSVYIYIIIIGGGVSSGVILQRFPEKDWPDTPFIEGIEWVKFIFFFFLEDRFAIPLCYLYIYCPVVLSTARMGLIDRKARTTFFCFDIDRYRCKSTLLRLYVLQRNGIYCAK